jgi:hypothetical protein
MSTCVRVEEIAHNSWRQTGVHDFGAKRNHGQVSRGPKLSISCPALFDAKHRLPSPNLVLLLSIKPEPQTSGPHHPLLSNLFPRQRGDMGFLTPTKSRNLFNGIQKHVWTILPLDDRLEQRQGAARPRRHPRQPYLYLANIFQMPPTTRPPIGAKTSPLPS